MSAFGLPDAPPQMGPRAPDYSWGRGQPGPWMVLNLDQGHGSWNLDQGHGSWNLDQGHGSWNLDQGHGSWNPDQGHGSTWTRDMDHGTWNMDSWSYGSTQMGLLPGCKDLCQVIHVSLPDQIVHGPGPRPRPWPVHNLIWQGYMHDLAQVFASWQQSHLCGSI